MYRKKWTRINAWLQFLMVLILLSTFLGCPKNDIGNATPEKLLIFGVDAASWDVLDRVRAEVSLPTFETLIQQGRRARLKTLNPTVSVMLWTTIATGRTPEHHGISSWLMEGPDTSGQLAITSDQRKVPAIWNLDGSRMLFANWWATWPAEDINGIMISNRAHFSGLDRVISPQRLTGQLRTAPKITLSELESELTAFNPYHTPIHLDDFTFSQLQKDRFYLDLTADFLLKEQITIAGVFVRGIDILEHEYLHDVLPIREALEMEPDLKGIVPSYYRYLDAQLQRLMTLMGPQTGVIIVSDHGMDPVGELPPAIEGLRIDDLIKWVNQISTVDQETSPIFLVDNHLYPPGLIRGLTIPEDIALNEQQTTRVLESSIHLLRKITSDGKPLFTSAELSDNPEEAVKIVLNPDIRIDATLTYNTHSIRVLEVCGIVIHPRAGQHWNAPDGIFLMSGPGIAPSEETQDIRIQDIAPTVCAYGHLPVARDLDGQPDLTFFSPRFLEESPVTWVTSYGPRSQNPAPETHPEIDASIREELRQLGYIQR